MLLAVTVSIFDLKILKEANPSQSQPVCAQNHQDTLSMLTSLFFSQIFLKVAEDTGVDASMTGETKTTQQLLNKCFFCVWKTFV